MMIKQPRMLVIGAEGMTGYYVPEAFPDYTLELTGKETLDVRDFSQVRGALQEFAPTVVLNLAAETDVDLCEQDPKHAFLTNTVGAQNVAIACQEIGALLVHFSTTSIFRGTPDKIYTEFDSAQPIHIHGHSKWESERIVSTFSKRFLIVRPGWMFGGFHRDKKLVGVLRNRIVYDGCKEIQGVIDTKGSPTYALDCLKLTRQLIENGLLGTFHVVNAGFCTRFEMAQLVAQHYDISVEPVLSEEFVSIAPRPASEMVHTWMLDFYGLAEYIRDWRVALKEYLARWDELDLKIG